MMQHKTISLWDLPGISRAGGIMSAMQKWHSDFLEQNGTAFGTVSLLKKKFVYVGEPDLIEFIFDNPGIFDKSQTLLEPMREATFDNGLITAPMPQWRRQHPAVRPAFHGPAFTGYVDIVEELTQDMIANEIAPTAYNGSSLDMDTVFENITSKVLAKAMMSIDGGLILPINEIRDITDSINFIYNYNFLSYFAGDFKQFLPLRSRFKTARDHIRDVSMTVVNRYIEHIAQNDIQAGFDLVSSMIIEGISTPEVAANFMSFIFAGFDTARSLLKTLLRRAFTSGYLEQLRGEVDRTDLDRKEILKLPYLDAFVDEALRIEGPAYLLMREVTETVQLGSHILQPGTTLIFSPHIMHMDERFWHQPQEFYLNRNPLPGTYFPFGAKTRKCIGANFGKMEVKLIFVALLQQFEWFVVPGDDSPQYGAAYQRPLTLRFHLRDTLERTR